MIYLYGCLIYVSRFSAFLNNTKGISMCTVFRTFFIFFVFLTAHLTAQPILASESWQIDSLRFSAYASGDTIEGSFTDVRSSVFLNFDELSQSSAEAVVHIASIQTPKATQKELLLGEDFFQASNHKVARLVAQSFTKIDNERYAMKAVLTIRGISRPVTMPFRFTSDGKITGQFSINRTWFGIGRGSWESKSKINHPVQIHYYLSRSS